MSASPHLASPSSRHVLPGAATCLTGDTEGLLPNDRGVGTRKSSLCPTLIWNSCPPPVALALSLCLPTVGAHQDCSCLISPRPPAPCSLQPSREGLWPSKSTVPDPHDLLCDAGNFCALLPAVPFTPACALPRPNDLQSFRDMDGPHHRNG